MKRARASEGRELRAKRLRSQLKSVNQEEKSYATCSMNDMLRKVVLGVVMSVVTAAARGGDRIDVWVLLTEPPIASGTSTADSIKQQQQAVMAELHALGAVELGRVSTARNAIAVSIDEAKLPEVKRLPGVRSVSPVRHVRRDPVPPPPPTR